MWVCRNGPRLDARVTPDRIDMMRGEGVLYPRRKPSGVGPSPVRSPSLVWSSPISYPSESRMGTKRPICRSMSRTDGLHVVGCILFYIIRLYIPLSKHKICKFFFRIVCQINLKSIKCLLPPILVGGWTISRDFQISIVHNHLYTSCTRDDPLPFEGKHFVKPFW